MKQTAVEWLTEKLRTEFGFAFSNNILEQAKEMEKQQQEGYVITKESWDAADKITHDGFIYVKFNDLNTM
jgi:hypothetical protein